MKVLPFALCLFVANGGVSQNASTEYPKNPKNPDWNSTILVKYQSAWKAINQEGRGNFYLFYRSYNLNITCVNTRAKQTFAANRSVLYETQYFHTFSKLTMKFSQLAKAAADDGKRSENTIEWVLPNGEVQFRHRVVFSDGKRCTILSSLNVANVFEMWVHHDSVHHVPSCCEFVYFLVSKGLDTYKVYDEAICPLTATDLEC